MADGGNPEAGGAQERAELKPRIGVLVSLRRQDIGESEERVPRCQGDLCHTSANRPVTS